MPRNNIAKRCKFFIWDSYSALPFLLLLLKPGWTTFWALFVTTLVLFLLERRGMTLPMLFRYLRVFLIGPSRQIRPWWRRMS